MKQHPFTRLRQCFYALLLLGSAALPPVHAQTAAPTMGIIVMHGKGGSPTRHVNELASALAAQGYLVANLDMPWSGRREYDAPLAAAEQEVSAAIGTLQGRGATRFVVAGHSQGGLFALYYGSRHALAGAIAIAPGGDPGSNTPREKLADSVQLARKLVDEGKGDDKTRLTDYEGGKGTYPLLTTPRIYLSWFDPDGGWGMFQSLQHMPAATAVLYVAPSNDYPGLARLKQPAFAALPPNPKTELYEPNASHLGAPSASIAKILAWLQALNTAP